MGIASNTFSTDKYVKSVPNAPERPAIIKATAEGKRMKSERIDRARGCLLGLAIGDAIGTTVEFKPRGGFTPMTDMVGGGPF